MHCGHVDVFDRDAFFICIYLKLRLSRLSSLSKWSRADVLPNEIQFTPRPLGFHVHCDQHTRSSFQVKQHTINGYLLTRATSTDAFYFQPTLYFETVQNGY